jgi:outer membrane protein assembly factor BamD
MSISALNRTAFFALALVLPLMAGCSGDPKDAYRERPVEDLYNEAMNLMNDGDYQKAAKAFDEVDRQHPYSVWATRAQLMGAYAHYERNKFDDAINALDRFIQLHPSHKDAPYAYYMKALCYYEQITDVARDQRITDQALKALQEVVDRFPNSRYARDAKLKIDLARDHLAGKEMNIGRWYERQHLYLAAINRYRAVIENYQTTSHIPEALHRLDECYESLGLHDEAKKVAAVLGYNYPGSPWYEDSYDLVKGIPREKLTTNWFDWLW